VITAFVPDSFPPEAIAWVQQYFDTRNIVLKDLDWRDLATADESSTEGLPEDTGVYIFGASAYVVGQDFIQHTLDYYEDVVKAWARKGVNAHVVWLQQNADGSWSLVLKTTGNALLELDADQRWREEVRADMGALD